MWNAFVHLHSFMKVFYNLDNLQGIDRAVVTIGSFDGVHLGHKTLIDQIKKEAAAIRGQSVVITFEPHPRIVLEKSPVNFALLTDLNEKIRLLEDCGVDSLIIVPFNLDFAHQPAETYLSEFLVKKIKPHTIVVGYDHHFGLGRKGNFALMKKVLEPLGINVIEVNPKLIDEITISSTVIRKALQAGDISQANTLLGHPYLISGTVEKGDGIGRKLGFPTANIKLRDDFKALPLDGIYLAQVDVRNNTSFGLVYIGQRPVLGESLRRVVEVYIYDFDENIYDNNIDVKLTDFIREDKKIENLDALKIQMEIDKADGRNLIKKRQEIAPSLAVVVLNYNGLGHLKRYLPELIEYSQEADIIVADNASTDGSVEYLNTLKEDIKIILLDRNYGFTGGYNRIISKLEHTYVLLLNSDVRVTKGWLGPLIQVLDQDEWTGAVQPKILNDRNKSFFDYAGASGGWIDRLGYPFCRGRIFDEIEEDKGQYDTPMEVFWASGAAMLTRRELYQKFGGLDDDFFAHMEEIDLCWRMKNAGYSVKIEPASVVYHYGGGTLDANSPFKTFLNFRNSLFVLLKNEKNHLWLKIFIRLCLDGIAGMRFFLQGKTRFVLAILKAHFEFYAKAGKFIRKRKKLKVLQTQRHNTQGRIKGLIIWQYFVKGKKFFSEL